MIRTVIGALCCLVMFAFGCGGATPEPEAPENAGAHASNVASASDESGDPQDDLVATSDPETTEEVIETSDPLD